MSIRDDFFTAQAKASLWDVAVSIKRGNPLPLDANSVFKALGTVGGEDYTGSLREYAATNPVAYPGQICAVVGVDATTVYYLDQNLEVQPVGVIPTGDSKTIEVTGAGAISLLGAAGAANGTLPMIGDDGKLTWKTLEDIGAGDGNDNTTYEFAFADQKITVTPKFNGQPIMEGEGEEQTQVIYTLDLSTFVTETELADAIKDFVTTDTTYSVKEGEKVLKLEGTEFSTVASLKYVPAVEANAETGTEAVPAKIQLCGIGDAVVSEIDATPFIKDGVLKDVAYDADSNTLTFTWNTDEGDKTDTVVLSDIIEPYTAGNGLELSGNEFAVKKDTASESYLTVSEAGIKVSGIDAAIEAAEGRAAADAQTKANTAKSEAIADAAGKYYGKSEVYTKSETDSKIDEKIASVTGGESAADVKLALESYRDAANTEIWGPEAANWTTTVEEDGKTKVTYAPQYGTKSRIDILEEAVDALEAVGAQANVIEAVVGAADNRLSITTSGKTVTIDDANLRTDIAAALKAGTDAGAAAGVNASAISGHDTRIGALETAKNGFDTSIKALQDADTTANGKILALETTVDNTTSGVAATYAIATQNKADIATLVATDKTHGEDIAALKETVGGHTTTLQNVNAALENIYRKNEVYTKGEVDTAVSNAVADKITIAALEPYAKTADVSATYATIAALEAEAKTARAAEKANADALAILHGNIEGDKTKSIRTIAAEEINALIKAADDEGGETIENIANLVDYVEKNAGEIAALVTQANASTAKLADVTTTVGALIDEKITAAAYTLPVATAEKLGGIKASASIAVAADGTATVAKVSTDILEQGTEELILFGGTSGANA
jgi:hypothetical protein